MTDGGTKKPIDLARLQATRRHAIVAFMVFLAVFVLQMMLVSIAIQRGSSVLPAFSIVGVILLIWMLGSTVRLGVQAGLEIHDWIIALLLLLVIPYIGGVLYVIYKAGVVIKQRQIA